MDGLTPSCSWIQLAGSLRRQKAMIGDVEIVAVSTDGRLYEALDARLADGKIAHITNHGLLAAQRTG
jgi:DNA polymerase/3'-5' exonuclease PolX